MFRSVSIMAIAAALGQAIQLFATLLLTAYYAPAAFGDLAIVSTASAFLAVIIGLQLPFAVSVAADVNERDAIINIVQWHVWISLFFLVPLALITQNIYVIAGSVGAAICLGNSMKALAVSKELHTRIAAFYIWRAIIITALQFLFISYGPMGLVAGLTIGELIASILLTLILKRSPLNLMKIPFKTYRSVLNKNKPFTVHGVAQELISNLTILIPFLVADALYSADAVGNYGLAYRFTWGPASIIGVNLGWYILGALGRNDLKVINTLTRYEIGIGLIILGILAAFTIHHFAPLAGELYDFGEWSLAISIVPILMSAICLFMISVPYRQIFRYLRLQKIQLMVDGACVVVMLGFALSKPETIVNWIILTTMILIVQNMALIFIGMQALRSKKTMDKAGT